MLDPAAERSLLPDFYRATAPLARDQPQRRAPPRPVRGQPRQLAVLQVLREHELHLRCQRFADVQARARIDAAGDEVEIGNADRDGVQADGLRGEPEQIARQRFDDPLLIHDVAPSRRFAGGPPCHQQRSKIRFRERRIGPEARAKCVDRSSHGHRDVVIGYARVGGDVEHWLDTPGIRERDGSALDAIRASAGAQLSSLTQHDRAHEGGSVQRALEPQICAELDAPDVRVEAERLARFHSNVERDRCSLGPGVAPSGAPAPTPATAASRRRSAVGLLQLRDDVPQRQDRPAVGLRQERHIAGDDWLAVRDGVLDVDVDFRARPIGDHLNRNGHSRERQSGRRCS